MKWWTYIYNPEARVVVPVGEEPLQPETAEEPAGEDFYDEPVAAETEEERAERLKQKALRELQEISDDDWKNREEDEKRKAAEILVRLRSEAEEAERRKIEEVQAMARQQEEDDRRQEEENLARAQEVYERLMREAEEDERSKIAEIEQAKAEVEAMETAQLQA